MQVLTKNVHAKKPGCKLKQFFFCLTWNIGRWKGRHFWNDKHVTLDSMQFVLCHNLYFSDFSHPPNMSSKKRGAADYDTCFSQMSTFTRGVLRGIAAGMCPPRAHEWTGCVSTCMCARGDPHVQTSLSQTCLHSMGSNSWTVLKMGLLTWAKDIQVTPLSDGVRGWGLN